MHRDNEMAAKYERRYADLLQVIARKSRPWLENALNLYITTENQIRDEDAIPGTDICYLAGYSQCLADLIKIQSEEE